MVLLYWKFFYYKDRNAKTAQFYVLIPAVIATLVGFYAFLRGTEYDSFRILYYVSFVYLTTGFILVLIACLKHELNPQIDYTLSWFKKTLGKFSIYLAFIVSYPAFFFMIIGTYYLLGNEHIYLWILVFGAWTVSQLKLFFRYVIK